jgi:hypothetical protein
VKVASSLISALVVVLLLPVPSVAAAAESGESTAVEASAGEKIRLNSIDETQIDAAEVGYELARTFLSQEQWDDHVKIIKKKFHDWEKENEGDIGHYLNDRFIIVVLGASSGDIKKVKQGIIWLAYYKEFNQPVPSAVTNAMTKHRDSLLPLFGNFSWARVSVYIKNKEWRSDSGSKSVPSLHCSRGNKGS